MLKHKKKIKRDITFGVINIMTTFNNTIISISDKNGNVICSSSSGAAGFKGAKKSTSFAAQTAARIVALKAMNLGLLNVEIFVKGQGNGRDAALRSFFNSGLKIMSIEDCTSIPYNGCRPPKKRRL